MITLEDCQAFCDAEPTEVRRAEHEHRLPPVIALAEAHARACQRVRQPGPGTQAPARRPTRRPRS